MSDTEEQLTTDDRLLLFTQFNANLVTRQVNEGYKFFILADGHEASETIDGAFIHKSIIPAFNEALSLESAGLYTQVKCGKATIPDDSTYYFFKDQELMIRVADTLHECGYRYALCQMA